LSSVQTSQALANEGGTIPDVSHWNIVTGPAQLEEFAKQTERLCLRPRRLEHDLMWLARTYHGEHATCGAIALYRDGALVNYLPFRLRDAKLRLRLGDVTVVRLPFRALQLYGDAIVGENADVASACAALSEIGLPYDGLTLEETPTRSAIWRALKQSNKKFLVFERSRTPHYVIDLPSSYADYFQQLSQKTRTNVRRGARQLEARLGHWEVRKFTAPENVLGMVQLIEPIAIKTFHYHLLGQDLTTSNEQLIRNLTIHAQQGWLRGYVLVGNNRPVAYVIGYLVNGCFQYELIGYDPEFANASPGIVLLAQIVEDLINTGTANLLDFGAGDASYKRLFSNRLYEDGELLVCRRTLYAGTAALAERLFASTSRLGVRVLQRTGMKARLKKFIRSKGSHTVQ
jgi:CelD/BcsL family acetyltransferase involved in cellulose biosynthesis